MDKNPLGKLYTLRESLVAAVTCIAHCNPTRVLILALDLLDCACYNQRLQLKDNKQNNWLVVNFISSYSLSTHFIVLQNPKLQQTFEGKITYYLKERHESGGFQEMILRGVCIIIMHDNSYSARIQTKAISLLKLKVAFITKRTVFLYWQEKNKFSYT